MIPTKNDIFVKEKLFNANVVDYDNIIKQYYYGTEDLLGFINLIKKDNYTYSRNNPIQCIGNASDFRNKVLQLAEYNISSFWNINFVGMSLCMSFESPESTAIIKNYFDSLFAKYWNYNAIYRRTVDKAIITSGSVSDTCVPIFWYVYQNDINAFKKYVPFVKKEYNNFKDDGHREHFMLKLCDMLNCILKNKMLTNKQVKTWCKIFINTFSWNVYDITDYIFKIKNINNNALTKPTKLLYKDFDALQQVCCANVPYYVKVDILMNLFSF